MTSPNLTLRVIFGGISYRLIHPESMAIMIAAAFVARLSLN